MWWRAIVASAIGLFGLATACSLSLSGFADGPTDGGASKTPDGAVVPSVDAGDAATPTCTAEVQFDPHNCGVCGHDCLGGACVSGVCQLVVLKSDFNHPLGVDVTSTKIYVTDSDGLWELDLDAKNAVNVVPNLGARYVVATDTDVYFSDGTNNVIRRWPRSGGDSVVVVPNVPVVENVRLSPDHMYFTRYQDPGSSGGVYRVTFPGFDNLEQVLSYNHPEGLQWRDNELYIGSDDENDVVSVDPDGTQHVVFVGGGPSDFALDGNDLFVAEQGGGLVIQTGADGGTVTPLVSGLANPSGIVATPTALYFVEYGGSNLDLLAR